jgi:hypothetical protein
MPKTIIEFNEEEQHEATIALNGWRYHHVIWELQQYLRGEMKHGDLSDDRYECYEKIRTKLYDLIDENKAHLE